MDLALNNLQRLICHKTQTKTGLVSYYPFFPGREVLTASILHRRYHILGFTNKAVDALFVCLFLLWIYKYHHPLSFPQCISYIQK